jgi:hypothetical protein
MLSTRKAVSTKATAIPAERIEGATLLIRGEKVMLDVALEQFQQLCSIGSCENPFSHASFAGIFPEFAGGWESSMHRVEIGISTQRRRHPAYPWREGDARCCVSFPVSSADRDA